MSQDSSFGAMFDLESQSGVMAVLAAIRASALPPSEKNELRDLVFLYTNGGRDASVKISLEHKLTASKIVPAASRVSPRPAPTLPFGSYRPTPTFRAPASLPRSSTPPAATPIVVPVAPQPVAVATVAPVPAQAPIAPSVPIPVPTAAPAPVATPAVPPVAAPAPQSQSSSLPKEEDYLERIRQIKTAVNSKVGNPVNLVDIDNAAGREYMNALLEAMKKLSSGAISEMQPAMTRLEAAYSAVELAIKNHGAGIKTSVPEPVVSAPVTTPVPATLTPPVSLPQPTPAEPVNDFRIPVTSAPMVSEPPTTPVSRVADRPSIPLTDLPSTIQSPSLAERVEVEQSGFATMPAAAPVATSTAPSLAEAARILTPNDLPKSSALETGDALYTSEVDDGLEQLLADWTLFKKSGLFGTGPKGREHPLFKKVAGLQIPLLLAGRFEGATPEIRQSISDYMNGWRYEQGIVYETGETFEKYLRRVIRHILDLQRKRK